MSGALVDLYAHGLKSAGGEVDTRAAAAPVAGQALVATGPHTAAWSGRSGLATDSPSSNQDDYNPSSFATARALSVTPTASIQITGFAAGANGDVVTICNDSTDFAIILARENGASAAANRITFPIVSFPAIALMPGDSVDLMYRSGRWHPTATAHPWNIWDECFAGVNDPAGTFHHFSFGGGGIATRDPGTYSGTAIGALALVTGGGAARILGDGFRAYDVGQGCAMHVARVYLDALSTVGDNFYVYSGFISSPSGFGEDSVQWAYRENTGANDDPNWQRSSFKAFAGTFNPGGLAASASRWVWLGIFMNADWTRADFFYSSDAVDWIFDGSETAGLPTPGGPTRCSAGVAIVKTGGAPNDSVLVDALGLRYDVERANS